MAIRYRCPNCQKLLRAGSRSAGKKIACPACGDKHTVPAIAVDEPIVVSTQIDEAAPGSVKSAGQVEDCESYFQMPAARSSKTVEPERMEPLPYEPDETASFEREVDEGENEDDMAFAPQRRIRAHDELDLIPMVDCVFLLLVFYMITASYGTQKTISVAPPDPAKQGQIQIEQEEPEAPRDSIVVRIDEQNLVYVDDIQLPDRKTLTDTLTARRAGSQDVELVIEADASALQESLIAVVDAAQELKFNKVRVAPVGGAEGGGGF
jgi:biopolymer transport protein ExbD